MSMSLVGELLTTTNRALRTNRDKVGLRGDCEPIGIVKQDDHDLLRRHLREFPNEPI